MAVKLTITVADITGTLGAGYTKLKVYRSPMSAGVYDEVTTPSMMIQLQAGQSEYVYIDGGGTTAHWYKTTFYNPTTPSESSFSGAFNGDYYDLGFPSASYPPEAVFTNDDYLVLDKIRNLIGDRKEVVRDYTSPNTGSAANISDDGYTYTLSNPNGWPLRVILDDTEYTSIDDPVVNGYKSVTFSGGQITASGTLDLWYHHFRYSDTEILQVYNGLTPPYPLTAEQVTFELSVVSAAIELLTSELGMSSSSAGIEVDIFEEIRVNPKAGLDSRYNMLKALLARRQAIIDDIAPDTSSDNLWGVLID